MREQIRLWFYSQLFMSVVLVGVAPFRKVLGYEKMLDEHGREMHGSWGNLILAEDAFEEMGADVMRWQYCAQPPDRNILFGYGPAHEIKRRFLRFWNSVKFLVDSANAERFTPCLRGRAGAGAIRSTAGSSSARAQLVAEATEAYEQFLTHRVVDAFESYADDLSNWYIRRSRPRFYSYDAARLRHALVVDRAVAAPDRAADAVRHRAPVAEPRARRLRRRARVGAPRRLARGGRAGRGGARPRWPRCGGSSSSGIRRAERQALRCASRSGACSFAAPRSSRVTRTRSRTS